MIILQKLFQELYSLGLRLLTNIGKDIKNHLLEEDDDKINLRKRSLIESVFNVLKNRMCLERMRRLS